jgi:L-fucose isomerase-like protein
MKKLTFALYFGNRGFFPGELIDAARKEMREAVKKTGHDSIEMDSSLTRYGAVETMAEGKLYAKFLEENRGKYDGVILCLPNFGDENGAVAALRNADVPILLQAYPDEFGLMDFEHRRDAFCGKLSIADVFRQNGIAFTAFEPHTCHPASEEFGHQLTTFAQVCSVVKRMRTFNVGAIGARTTVFKTIRFDELALSNYDINTETLDLSQLFAMMHSVDKNSDEFKQARSKIAAAADCSKMPEERLEAHAALYVSLKKIASDYYLDAMGLRCWNEMQSEFKIAPCMTMGILNQEGLPVACELDVCNAIAMAALQAASDAAPICMDWNNNYGDDPDKCILFHCGSVPPEAMTEKGHVISHKMFDKGSEKLGGIGWGCNQGRVRPSPMTYLSAKTEDGHLSFYMGEGYITDDPIEHSFFGCAGVAQIAGLQQVLRGICKQGFRHHVSLALDHVEEALREAFETYLGYDVIDM